MKKKRNIFNPGVEFGLADPAEISSLACFTIKSMREYDIFSNSGPSAGVTSGSAEISASGMEICHVIILPQCEVFQAIIYTIYLHNIFHFHWFSVLPEAHRH
jgi:hypothetical protein